MIPEKKEIKEIIKLIKKEIGKIGEKYKINFKVIPFLFYDMGYEIKRKEKIINIHCYSGTYPYSFSQWYKQVSKEIKNKLEVKK